MIMFFAAKESRVVETLRELLAGFQFKRCRSVNGLAKCLRKPCHGLEIGLMVIGTAEEMTQLGKFQNLIRDFRIVLVLPRHDPEMVSMAHKLGPRFIAYADNGFEQAAAVVRKMAAKSQYRKSA